MIEQLEISYHGHFLFFFWPLCLRLGYLPLLACVRLGMGGTTLRATGTLRGMPTFLLEDWLILDQQLLGSCSIDNGYSRFGYTTFTSLGQAGLSILGLFCAIICCYQSSKHFCSLVQYLSEMISSSCMVLILSLLGIILERTISSLQSGQLSRVTCSDRHFSQTRCCCRQTIMGFLLVRLQGSRQIKHSLSRSVWQMAFLISQRVNSDTLKDCCSSINQLFSYVISLVNSFESFYTLSRSYVFLAYICNIYQDLLSNLTSLLLLAAANPIFSHGIHIPNYRSRLLLSFLPHRMQQLLINISISLAYYLSPQGRVISPKAQSIFKK